MTSPTDNKGDDLDFELKAPEKGKVPVRRVEPTCLLDILYFSSQTQSTIEPTNLHTASKAIHT